MEPVEEDCGCNDAGHIVNHEVEDVPVDVWYVQPAVDLAGDRSINAVDNKSQYEPHQRGLWAVVENEQESHQTAENARCGEGMNSPRCHSW